MSSSHSETRVPRAFNHVGLTVPDIDRAIAWYGAVFGFQRVPPVLYRSRP
ncbi:VOC family protein [Cupriavidus necator]